MLGGTADEGEGGLDDPLTCHERTQMVQRYDIADDPGCLMFQLCRLFLALLLYHLHKDWQDIRLSYSLYQPFMHISKGTDQFSYDDGTLDD